MGPNSENHRHRTTDKDNSVNESSEATLPGGILASCASVLSSLFELVRQHFVVFSEIKVSLPS